MIGAAFLAWGSVMTWVCLTDLPRSLGPAGGLIILSSWLAPSLLLLLRRNWFLSRPLSQRWLIGLQLWRAIGGVFLIEMTRGNIPGIFAYPAGIGDILVACLAGAVLIRFRNAHHIPRAWVVAIATIGILDFISAFFFGFTSSEGPLQLFTPAVRNDSLLFPTGMIPLFLVPYAIFFHTLSLLSLRRSGPESDDA